MHHIPWGVVATLLHEAAPLLHAHRDGDGELQRCLTAIEDALAGVKEKVRGEEEALLARLADGCRALAAHLERDKH